MQPSGFFFIRPFHTFTSITLQLFAQVDMHRLDVDVVQQGFFSQLATNCKSEVVRIKSGGGCREKE